MSGTFYDQIVLQSAELFMQKNVTNQQNMMVLCTLFVLATALCKIQGVQKKMSRSFCLTSPVIYILESWDIIHLKGGIHSFVWSTKTFLYDIREPRYKQIKMGYQISKCLNIGQS